MRKKTHWKYAIDFVSKSLDKTNDSLFQKRIVCTKFDIYVCILLDCSFWIAPSVFSNVYCLFPSSQCITVHGFMPNIPKFVKPTLQFI